MMKATAISATLAAALIGCASGQQTTNEPANQPGDTVQQTPADTTPGDEQVDANEMSDGETMKANVPASDAGHKEGKAGGCGAGGCGASKKSEGGTAKTGAKKEGKAAGCGAGGCGATKKSDKEKEEAATKKAEAPKTPPKTHHTAPKTPPKKKTGSTGACGAGTCG
jgi:hypothetical protein